MKPNSLVRLARRGRRAGLLAFVSLAVTGAICGSALAKPTINVIYDPTVDFSATDKTVIQNALNFYTNNMTSDFTVTVAFGSQAAGGATTTSLITTETYNAYYNALVANTSGDAVDASSIASLGGPSFNNPVTGTPRIGVSTTLASFLGLSSQVNYSFATCDNLVANACIDISSAALNAGGAPLAGLNALVQHEFDEVLGTTSALSDGVRPSDPRAADLYRYGAPGVRSFALNSSTAVPCTGSPTAYFSVNGGAANLQTYNNCDNGGDYGDWIGTDGKLVQDAFSPDDVDVALDANSSEIKLLDAVGYNFSFGAAVPEPGTWALMVLGLGAVGASARSRRRTLVFLSA